MGEVSVPLSDLKGIISLEKSGEVAYENSAIQIVYKLDLRKSLERSAVVKQYTIDQRYPLLDLKKSEDLPSCVRPSAAKTPMEFFDSSMSQNMDFSKKRLSEQVYRSETQIDSSSLEAARRASLNDPPNRFQKDKSIAKNEKSHINQKMEETKAKKETPGKIVPPNVDEEIIEEEDEIIPPQGNEKTATSHPQEDQLIILTKTEFTEFMVKLKAAKAEADKQSIDLKKLIEFEKLSFSTMFLTVYQQALEKQQEAMINAKTVDSEGLAKCKAIVTEVAKRLGQITRNVESGKLSPEEYLGVLKSEFDELMTHIKFIKKIVKVQKVLKFLLAKANIMNEEIKELEDFLKMQST